MDKGEENDRRERTMEQSAKNEDKEEVEGSHLLSQVLLLCLDNSPRPGQVIILNCSSKTDRNRKLFILS